jgi:hypothetical protein
VSKPKSNYELVRIINAWYGYDFARVEEVTETFETKHGTKQYVTYETIVSDPIPLFARRPDYNVCD